MHRRNLLKSAAGVVCLPLGGLLEGQTGPPKQAKIISAISLARLSGTFTQKLEIAAKAGLQSVELDTEHAAWSADEIRNQKKLLLAYGMRVASVAGTSAGVDAALEHAQALEAPFLILKGGGGQTLSEAAGAAVAKASKAGVALLVQPSDWQMKTVETLNTVKAMSTPAVRLVLNVYDEQMETASVVGALTEALPYTSIIRVADTPGRKEPGSGDINYPELCRAIAKANFEGYLSLDYAPGTTAVTSLIRVIDLLRRNLVSA